jgi:hypothetical protein
LSARFLLAGPGEEVALAQVAQLRLVPGHYFRAAPEQMILRPVRAAASVVQPSAPICLRQRLEQSPVWEVCFPRSGSADSDYSTGRPEFAWCMCPQASTSAEPLPQLLLEALVTSLK